MHNILLLYITPPRKVPSQTSPVPFLCAVGLLALATALSHGALLHLSAQLPGSMQRSVPISLSLFLVLFLFLSLSLCFFLLLSAFLSSALLSSFIDSSSTLCPELPSCHSLGVHLSLTMCFSQIHVGMGLSPAAALALRLAWLLCCGSEGFLASTDSYFYSAACASLSVAGVIQVLLVACCLLLMNSISTL